MELMTTATAQDEEERRARGPAVAVLPVGSFEQHSDFLPLITDTAVACLIAERLSAAYDLFLLPPVTISCSQEHEGFAGAVSISARTLYAVIDDIRQSLRRTGTDRLVVVSGHGGNYVLQNVVQEANVDGPRVVLFPTTTDRELARRAAGLETAAGEDMHAGELETALLLDGRPELVGPRYAERDWVAPARTHLLVSGMRAYTPSGVVGRPSLATPEKGRAYFESLIASFAEHLQLLSPGNGAVHVAGREVVPVGQDGA
ncbi:MAG: creatininase family protein [Chloroflexota bacterium]|nr:creatininase family protein [Chloroflexota bacterium]